MFYTDLKKRGQLKIIKLREKAIKRYKNSESLKEIYYRALVMENLVI